MEEKIADIDILEEKEKKAINNLNFIIVTDIYGNEVSIDKTKIINEYNESVGIVLNLVKTLIAENKEMKEEIEELKKYEKYYEEMEEVNKKFIAVDKIKAKIEELDIEIQCCTYADDDVEEYKQDIEKEKARLLRDKKTLQSLLGKE